MALRAIRLILGIVLVLVAIGACVHAIRLVAGMGPLEPVGATVAMAIGLILG